MMLPDDMLDLHPRDPMRLGSVTPPTTAVQRVERKPLRDEVYERIIGRILRGDVLPGERLRDVSLAEELGVSRTPVREALLRLQHDGVLEADLGRGFAVAPLSADEARQLSRILRALECLALDTAGPFTPDALDALDALNDRMRTAEPGEAFRLNGEWHLRLTAGCRNQRLHDLLAQTRLLAGRYVLAYLRAQGSVALQTEHHAEIVAALRADDRDTAVARLREHWVSGTAEIIAWIEAEDGTDAALRIADT